MQREELIAVAHRIGRGIVDQALWQDDACTWEVKTLDRATGGYQTEAAGGGLYQGSGGIALFLGELFRLTDDRRIGDAAEGGWRHALAEAEDLPASSFSFHGGRVGAAYLATRLAEPFAKPEYLEAARRLLKPLAGEESHDHGLDVIGGAAGAIPALLWLHDVLADDGLIAMARGLGDTLIASARHEPGGWSWGTVGPAATRHVTGFAHGASGAGLALLELSRATGEGRYRFAAEMAFLYERRLFDAAQCNWPDLRHREMNELYYSNQRDRLQDAEVAEGLPDYEPRFMTAWCHGSPGIGLARVRAFELTSQEVYRKEAEAALESTLAALEPSLGQGYSLCHGLGGNCELPLYAAEVFAEPFLREICQRCAEFGEQAYGQTGVAWPCGTIEQVPDPSLLLGEAGIGYFYLRLASPETPSILLLRPPLEAGGGLDVAEDDGFLQQSRLAVDEYFSQTLQAFETLQLAPLPAFNGAAESSTPIDRSPVEEAFVSLGDLVAGLPESRRRLAEDAFRLERERYRLAAVPNDLSRHFLRNLRRRPVENVAWDEATFSLAEDSLLLSTAWDWNRPRDASAPPPRRDQTWIIIRQGERLLTRPLHPFAAALLSVLEPGATLSEIVEGLLSMVGGSPDQQREMADRIHQQLRELYRIGWVDETTAAVGPPKTEGARRPLAASA